MVLEYLFLIKTKGKMSKYTTTNWKRPILVIAKILLFKSHIKTLMN